MSEVPARIRNIVYQWVKNKMTVNLPDAPEFAYAAEVKLWLEKLPPVGDGLLPCPCCGKPAVVEIESSYYRVACAASEESCYLATEWNTERLIVEKIWNQRV